MKPNELRIGNTLTSKTWLGYHRVDGIERIDDEIFEVKTKGYVHRHEKGTWFELVPIPLTEELLLKCGFESMEYGMTIRGYYYYKKPISIYLIKDGVEAEVSLCDDTINLSKNSPQYLHQLQNLFYAITGEELEIKL